MARLNDSSIVSKVIDEGMVRSFFKQTQSIWQIVALFLL